MPFIDISAPQLFRLSGPVGCEVPFFVIPLPAIQARYILSHGPSLCLPESEFPPLTYTAWLAPHRRKIYILTSGK
jgi:hypothetical protein